MTKTTEDLLALATRFDLSEDISVQRVSSSDSQWAVCTRTGARIAKDNFDRLVGVFGENGHNDQEAFDELTLFEDLNDAIDFGYRYIKHLEDNPYWYLSVDA